MKRVIRVAIGEARVGDHNDKLVTVVGSCVAVMLYDKKKKIGGMVHIMLGKSPRITDNPGKYADTGVRYLIELMLERGASISRLKGAKIAGGSEMFKFNSRKAESVSTVNIKAVQNALNREDIQIIAADCGGNKGRRVSFDLTNGRVNIESQLGPKKVI